MVDDQCTNIAQFMETAAKKGGKAFGYLEANVTEVSQSDVTKKDGTTSIVTSLAVQDSTGSINVELWDDTVGWKAGEVFSGTALYTSEFKGELKLSASRKSKISKKIASGSKTSTAAKSAAVKPAAAITAGAAVNIIALEKKLDHVKTEILNAITEMQVVLLDQMKEIIKLSAGPTQGEAGEGEATSEEIQNEPPEGA